MCILMFCERDLIAWVSLIFGMYVVLFGMALWLPYVIIIIVIIIINYYYYLLFSRSDT